MSTVRSGSYGRWQRKRPAVARDRPHMSSRRPGAALVMALLMIVVLDCIVLGTLRLSLQEHRLAANRSSVLQLRLDAESGAKRALGLWTADIDSLPVGAGHRIAFPPLQTPGSAVQVERVAEQLFLVESTAVEPAPRVGRASARLLVFPPALPTGVDPAPAPASAAGVIHVLGTGLITTSAPAGCIEVPPPNSILGPSFGITIDAGATLDAPIGALGPRALSRSFDRIRDLWPAPVPLDSTLSIDAAGALLVSGDFTVAAGIEFRGLVIAGGSVTLEPGAVIRGAVHAAGALTVAGTVAWDPCAVADGIEQWGLDRPNPAGSRAWLPAF
ncbi:MAG: hypothetical protein ACRELT_12190 [Longimicrobiales bacterium]